VSSARPAPVGRFIALEGGDGSGKTTLGSRLAGALRERGVPAVFVGKREDGVGDAFLNDRLEHLRTVLWDYPSQAPIHEWGDHHWFHLLVSWFSLWDRMRIRPLLAEARWVVVDGWIHKYVARFLLKPQLRPDYVRGCFDHVSIPETVILLDVDPEITAGRRPGFKATESGALDGFEGRSRADFIAYQARVRRNLLAMADESGWFILDGSHREETLVEQAVDSILGIQPTRVVG
jgi:thymidylate kinase